MMVVILTVALLAASAASAGSVTASKGIFGKGKVNGKVVGGYASSGGESYFLLGIGAGYYFIDGLGAGLDYETWLGGSPSYNKLSPWLGYVFWQVPKVKPYVSGFYRQTWIGDGYDDVQHIGGRFGIYLAQGRTWLGVGGVYEHRLNSDGFADKDQVYPEISVVIGF
jgi:hypothetical protein